MSIATAPETPLLRTLEDAQQAAIARYGAPLYFYDVRVLEERLQALQQHLPSNFAVHYALKANSNLWLCRRLAARCPAAEVSSLGELLAALHAGFDPGQIIFTGPGKRDRELLAALEKNVGTVVVESVAEARRLSARARICQRQQTVLVRINPQYRTAQSCEIRHEGSAAGCELAPIAMNGQGASKFGLDEAEAAEAIATISALDCLEVRGIHVFTESNVLDCQALLQAWKNTLAIADRLREAGLPVEVLDFGGGIGVPYNCNDAPFDLARFGAELQEMFARSPHAYRCVVEIGRYIACEAGHYLTEVLDLKHSRGETFAIINGGVHNLYRTPAMQPASKFSSVLGKATEARAATVTLAGSLPTPIDVLAREVPMPASLTIGDRIAIHNCGAYGFNHSLTNFALHPHPAEVAWLDGRLHLIRPRGEYEEFFARQLAMLPE